MIIHPLRITGRRNACSFLLGMILLLGSSCSNITQNTSTPTPLPEDLAPAQTTAVVPTALPTPNPTPVSISAATLSAPNNPSHSICSPLAIQPLNRLDKIITQPFIMPRIMDDGTYADDAHHGLDLGFVNRGKQKFFGTPVLAVIEGKIASIIHDRPPYGNMVMLETPFDLIPQKIITNHNIPVGDSLYTMYAHLQNLQQLEIGQEIACGQQLAETGLTGITSGPHLHFETRWGPANSTFPVMGFYQADVTDEEKKQYKIWRMSGAYQLFNPFELLNP